MSVLALAHVGDAVYELLVRTELCRRGRLTAGALHRETVLYVSATAQARAAERLLPRLTEEEGISTAAAGNTKVASVPRSAAAGGVTTAATALEALFGWLFLRGEMRRVEELFFLCHGGIGMPLDAITLTALTSELTKRLVGARIDKVQMPERDMLLLGLRGAGENLRLVLSAAGGTGPRASDAGRF
jgi:ribonuclease-3 family protein